ncbi:MAG: hypothetical protein NVSMB19_08480 [Vulcanimicrobiaceae bacterium]
MLALTAFAFAGLPADGRSAAINVLVGASVTEPAAATMSTELWHRLIARYVGGNVLPFAGSVAPTLEDCRKAGADYLVLAPFELRPMLPGFPSASGRVAARTHLVVSNCVTGSVVSDRTVDFDSDPPSTANEGDFESVPEISWARSVPATLAKFPLVFERIAHVIGVTPPLALVDIKSGARPGDGLRDFARADHTRRATPITLTVTQVFDRYLEVMFSSAGDRPAVGDLVEPIPANATR